MLAQCQGGRDIGNNLREAIVGSHESGKSFVEEPTHTHKLY